MGQDAILFLISDYGGLSSVHILNLDIHMIAFAKVQTFSHMWLNFQGTK